MRTFVNGLGAGTALMCGTFVVLAGGCGGGGATGTGAGTTSTSTTSTTTSGSTSTSTTSTSAGTSSGAGGGSTAIPCTESSTTQLSGVWAAYGQLAIKLEGQPGGAVTICPADQVGESTLLLLVKMTQDTADPTKLDAIQATLCSVDLPTTTALVGPCTPGSTSLISTQLIVPQKLIDALPKVAAATATGTLGSTAPGATFTVAPLDVVVGSTASGSQLPTWSTANMSCNTMGDGTSTTCDAMCVSDCTTLRDDDADGYPGVTIQVCGKSESDIKMNVTCNTTSPSMAGASIQGEGFVDLEVNPALTGTVKNSCEITGNITTQVIYNIVGANVYLGGAGPLGITSAIESLPTFNVDPTASKFHLVRVDGQYGSPNWNLDTTMPSAACATIIMRANELQ